MKSEKYSIQKLRKITLYRDDMNGRIKISSDTVHKDEDFLEKDLVLLKEVREIIRIKKMSKDKEGEYNLKKKKKKILDKFAYDMWDDSWENVKKSAPSIPAKVYLQMIEDMLGKKS